MDWNCTHSQSVGFLFFGIYLFCTVSSISLFHLIIWWLLFYPDAIPRSLCKWKIALEFYLGARAQGSTPISSWLFKYFFSTRTVCRICRLLSECTRVEKKHLGRHLPFCMLCLQSPALHVELWRCLAGCPPRLWATSHSHSRRKMTTWVFRPLGAQIPQLHGQAVTCFWTFMIRWFFQKSTFYYHWCYSALSNDIIRNRDIILLYQGNNP